MKAKKLSPKKRAAADAKKAKSGGSGKKVNFAEIMERAKEAEILGNFLLSLKRNAA